MKFKEEQEVTKVAPSERLIFTQAGVGDLEYMIPNIGFNCPHGKTPHFSKQFNEIC
eukprot:TRINITY_DN11028_c0_g1_i1.p3 TRINITY_DN11028_c0_g1~~TRINITY_DN11028_c0_g1_i1.p3  ORF type:complete len:56 (-),score=6.16 TRINITY_DN11028_c0_g1_i1:364-531(-)